jgi:G3E family GTPase
MHAAVAPIPVTPIPVTLLTGFLGSGKTTLLNAALRGAETPIGVVVNEFGAVGIDHDLVEAADEDVVLLAGGCACCAVRSDIGEALSRLARARAAAGARPFARIVVETTGLADPTPIEQLFCAPGAVSARHRLDRVVTTVDACLGAVTAASDPVWRRQVALADALVVTKTDLADHERKAALDALLQEINPGAARGLGTDGANLLAGAASRLPHPAPSQRARYGRVHDEQLAAYAARLRAPVDGDVLAGWLETLVSRHGHRLLRVKGLVRLAGEERPLVVHAVQHLVSPPRLLDAWPGDDHDTRLVFIARGLEPIDLSLGYAGAEGLEWT